MYEYCKVDKECVKGTDQYHSARCDVKFNVTLKPSGSGQTSHNKGPTSYNKGPSSYNKGPTSYNKRPTSYNKGPTIPTYNLRPSTTITTYNKCVTDELTPTVREDKFKK